MFNKIIKLSNFADAFYKFAIDPKKQQAAADKETNEELKAYSNYNSYIKSFVDRFMNPDDDLFNHHTWVPITLVFKVISYPNKLKEELEINVPDSNPQINSLIEKYNSFFKEAIVERNHLEDLIQSNYDKIKTSGVVDYDEILEIEGKAISQLADVGYEFRELQTLKENIEFLYDNVAHGINIPIINVANVNKIYDFTRELSNAVIYQGKFKSIILEKNIKFKGALDVAENLFNVVLENFPTEKRYFKQWLSELTPTTQNLYILDSFKNIDSGLMNYIASYVRAMNFLFGYSVKNKDDVKILINNFGRYVNLVIVNEIFEWPFFATKMKEKIQPKTVQKFINVINNTYDNYQELWDIWHNVSDTEDSSYWEYFRTSDEFVELLFSSLDSAAIKQILQTYFTINLVDKDFINSASRKTLAELEPKIKIVENMVQKLKTGTLSFGEIQKNIEIVNYVSTALYLIIQKEKIGDPGDLKQKTLAEIDPKYLNNDSGATDVTLDLSQKKHPQLYSANIQISSDRRFVVAEKDSPLYFTVGVYTNCCQRLGGEGEDAAIDSFINPLAGLLLYEVLIDNSWKLVAQSYFHYVPSDNGFVLDNVEKSLHAQKLANISDQQMIQDYHNLAIILKSKGFKYVYAGKAYSKIDVNSFESKSMKEDPRYFAVDDPYSDFDENDFIDLSKYKEKEQYKSDTKNIISPTPLTHQIRFPQNYVRASINRFCLAANK